jgi:type I restriction enzyme, S subunit
LIINLPIIDIGWSTKPLGDLCEVIMGQAPKGTSYNTDGKGMLLIAGAADLGTLTPQAKKWTTSPTKIGKKGDIIICVRATIGDLNWADKEYCYGRGVAALRVRDSINPTFLWFWLELCNGYLVGKGRGATFKQISKKDLVNLPMPDIDMMDQQHIVEQITACTDKVAEIQKLIRKREAELTFLRESILQKAFAGKM